MYLLCHIETGMPQTLQHQFSKSYISFAKPVEQASLSAESLCTVLQDLIIWSFLEFDAFINTYFMFSVSHRSPEFV